MLVVSSRIAIFCGHYIVDPNVKIQNISSARWIACTTCDVKGLCIKDNNMFALCESTSNLDGPYDYKKEWSTHLQFPKVLYVCNKNLQPWSTWWRMTTTRPMWLGVSQCEMIPWLSTRIHIWVVHFNQCQVHVAHRPKTRSGTWSPQMATRWIKIDNHAIVCRIS